MAMRLVVVVLCLSLCVVSPASAQTQVDYALPEYGSVCYSRTYVPEHPPFHACDGSDTTYYRSNDGTKADEWLRVDFGQNRTIRTFYMLQSGDQFSALGVTVSAWDGAEWFVVHVTNQAGMPDHGYTFPTPVTARYFEVAWLHGNPDADWVLGTVSFFGDSNATPTATSVPPTATSVPPTATGVPPTATVVGPTPTPDPLTPTPTVQVFFPTVTATPVSTPVPPDEAVAEYARLQFLWVVFAGVLLCGIGMLIFLRIGA